MTLYNFIATVFILASERRWTDLAEYFALVRELLNAPVAMVVPGTPTDKEIKP